MIPHIKIENYKSIPSLEIDLGRVNVFIGENGGGKTNILEGALLGSAAIQHRLESEYLGLRGFRVLAISQMKSAFGSYIGGLPKNF